MPIVSGVGGFVNVPSGPINGQGPPAASFKGQLGQMYFNVAVSPPVLFIYNGSTWDEGGNAQATETEPGVAELSTVAEALAGTNDTTIITPYKLAQVAIAGAPLASEATAGIAEIATAAEAMAGLDDSRFITPLKLADALAAGTYPLTGTSLTLSSFLTVGGLITGSASATINTAGTALNLATDSSADTVSLATGATARTVHIADSAAAHLVTIGSTNGAASLTLQAGSGNILVAGAVGTTITIGKSDGTGTITLGSSSAG